MMDIEGRMHTECAASDEKPPAQPPEEKRLPNPGDLADTILGALYVWWRSRK